MFRTDAFVAPTETVSLMLILGTRFRLDDECGVRLRFSMFEPVTFLDPSLFMLALGGEGSSWDEMGR